MSREAELEAENAMLREQLIGVVSHVMGGCTGVTVASNDNHANPPRGSKIVHRCLLEKRLQEALARAGRSDAGDTP